MFSVGFYNKYKRTIIIVLYVIVVVVVIWHKVVKWLWLFLLGRKKMRPITHTWPFHHIANYNSNCSFGDPIVRVFRVLVLLVVVVSKRIPLLLLLPQLEVSGPKRRRTRKHSSVNTFTKFSLLYNPFYFISNISIRSCLPRWWTRQATGDGFRGGIGRRNTDDSSSNGGADDSDHTDGWHQGPWEVVYIDPFLVVINKPQNMTVSVFY
jgi:hypothetical protein